MNKKLAIVAYALPSRKHVPFDDPDFEVWGLNQLYYKIPRADRWFEMHFVNFQDVRPLFYRDWLASQSKIPVYMQSRLPEIPMSVAYPREQMAKAFGNFFTCSVCWMMALGIHEGFREIRLYGVHARDGSAYEYQRPGITYFLGICRGRGIEYFVPPESELLKSEAYGYKGEAHEKNGNGENVAKHFHHARRRVAKIEYREGEGMGKSGMGRIRRQAASKELAPRRKER